VPPAARLLLALLAAAAPLLAAAQPEAAPAPDQCTPDLIKSIAWGVGTGAHQVEGRGGGRAPSVWEAFVARDAGAIADRSDAARGADFYGRFASDVALLQRLKVGFGGWRVAAGSVCGCTSGCTDTHAPHTTCWNARAKNNNQVKHFRLSLSWPRLIPGGAKGSPVNQEAVKFYNSVLDALLAAGIQPLVALYQCEWGLLGLLGRGR
jgi:beta-glucosidase